MLDMPGLTPHPVITIRPLSRAGTSKRMMVSWTAHQSSQMLM
jgi:hypothetical protein